MTPTAYFFDMDHTLADNDCDVSWKLFLVDQGIAPATDLERAEAFFDQYRRGCLEVDRFLEFQLAEFVGQTAAAMAVLARRHFEQMVRPQLYAAGQAAVAAALASGRPVALLTATNEVIAAPVAAALGIDELIATRLETCDGRYTGRLAGLYCAGPGKVAAAAAFCRARGLDLRQASYFGDSLNDLPLLRQVAFPVVCNPGDLLAGLAAEYHWPVRHWTTD